jgi:hypothetical protein
VERLELADDNAGALVDFWDLVCISESQRDNYLTVFKVLKNHLCSPNEYNQTLSLVSSFIQSMRKFPLRYVILDPPQYNRRSMGTGSFGKVYQGINPNLCIKLANSLRLNDYFKAVRPSFSFLQVPVM